jgi:hypothetical protein
VHETKGFSVVKLRDDVVAPLDLGALRTLDCHPDVRKPLARYHEVNRALISKQQELYENDKQLSVARGRARDEMTHVSFDSHTAIDALAAHPAVSQLELQQRVLQQAIADLRPALAEAEYRLSIARSDARAQITRQLNQEMAPALTALLQCLEAMVGPNSTIVALENCKQRLLMRVADPTMWENNLSGRIKRLRQRLSALTPPAEAEAQGVAQEAGA